MRDPYETLGVDSNADRATIQAAYRRLARAHHPDFGGDDTSMAELNEAWRVLGDADRRRQYDLRRDGRLLTPSRVSVRAPEAAGPIAAAMERRRRAASATADAAAPAAGERPPVTGDTALDFGRYAGWSIDALAVHDPDYLEWLIRMPIGRPLRAAVEASLATRRPSPIHDRPVPPREHVGGRGLLGRLRVSLA